MGPKFTGFNAAEWPKSTRVYSILSLGPICFTKTWGMTVYASKVVTEEGAPKAEGVAWGFGDVPITLAPDADNAGVAAGGGGGCAGAFDPDAMDESPADVEPACGGAGSAGGGAAGGAGSAANVLHFDAAASLAQARLAAEASAKLELEAQEWAATLGQASAALVANEDASAIDAGDVPAPVARVSPKSWRPKAAPGKARATS